MGLKLLACFMIDVDRRMYDVICCCKVVVYFFKTPKIFCQIFLQHCFEWDEMHAGKGL
jgi:hypothetical protein